MTAGRPAASWSTAQAPPGGVSTLRAAARCLALDVLATHTLGLLDAAGVPAVLIKGPALAHCLYPDRPDQRTYTDVDIMVPVDRFADAELALADDGYRTLLTGLRDGEFPWHETAWRRGDSAELTVDLHRGLAGLGDPAVFFPVLWATREQFELGGTTVFVPGPAATALIVMLHAANPGRNHKPLADLRRAREVLPPQVWAEAAQLARRCGAVDSCRAGIGLLPDGSALADRLGIVGAIGADTWLAGRQRDRISVNLAIALDERGAWAIASHIVRRMVPSPAFVRLFDARARTGPAGLALAYARRFWRVLLAGPRAIRDVSIAKAAIAAGSRGTGAAAPSSRRRIASRPIVTATGFGRRLLAAGHLDATAVRVAAWSFRARLRVARQLRRSGLNQIDLVAPPSVRDNDRAAVCFVLAASRATCLERSLVLQRFDAAGGRPRAIIIATTSPSSGFRAHAWLEGDRRPDETFQELLRRPVPPTW